MGAVEHMSTDGFHLSLKSCNALTGTVALNVGARIRATAPFDCLAAFLARFPSFPSRAFPPMPKGLPGTPPSSELFFGGRVAWHAQAARKGSRASQRLRCLLLRESRLSRGLPFTLLPYRSKLLAMLGLLVEGLWTLWRLWWSLLSGRRSFH